MIILTGQGEKHIPPHHGLEAVPAADIHHPFQMVVHDVDALAFAKELPVPSKVNVGLMIEVPAIVFQLEDVLKQADFISIGTNDLAQFTFACDRGNPRLTERYDVLSSPFLKMMGDIVAKADAAGVYCSVCGEMASNPVEAMALIGLGYRNLSSSGASYGRVKSMIRSVNVEEVTDYVKTLLKSQKRTLRPQLLAYAYDHGIEIY